MMRIFDWLFWGFIVAICAMVSLAFGGLAMMAYNDITSDKIQLTESDWTCTKTEKILVPMGKGLFPSASCIQYERNKSE